MDVLDLLSSEVPLRVEAVRWECQGLRVALATTALVAKCPLCSQLSTRVHSHYGRTVADLPCSGRAMRLDLRVRKFFCDNPSCSRSIFTEPLPQLVARYARRTLRLQEVLELIGLALGGQAGARLSRELRLLTSPDTILRAIGCPKTASLATPRVLGVDDFALCRGHTYGTILVDLEKHRVVDLLPDREAETLTDWLKQHPGVQVISRDRSEAYAQGARQGCPQATQVADRWHLLKNLAAALETLLLREHRALREAALPRTGEYDVPSEELHSLGSPDPICASGTARRLEQEKQQRRERRLARYHQVLELYQKGLTIRAVARSTRLSRKTVRRYIEAGGFPEITTRQPRPTQLEGFQGYLQTRWGQGCHNAAQLYRETCAHGYTGGLTQVREYLHRFRVQEAILNPEPVRAPTSTTVPSPRTVLWWLLKPDEQLEEEKQQFVGRLCRLSPTVDTARKLALWFFRMVRERRAEEFGDWIRAAREGGENDPPPLRAFAQKLLSDRAAVVAALREPWSNGQTEGQVNRLKLIKRQMYGRASFGLLKARVLAAA